MKVFALIATMVNIMALSRLAIADDTDPIFSLRVVAIPGHGTQTPTLRYDVTNTSHVNQPTIWHTYILPQTIMLVGKSAIYATRSSVCKHEPTIGGGPAASSQRLEPTVMLAPGQTYSYYDTSALCDWDFSRPGVYEGYGELQGGIRPSPSSPPNLIDLTAKWSLTIK